MAGWSCKPRLPLSRAQSNGSPDRRQWNCLITNRSFSVVVVFPWATGVEYSTLRHVSGRLILSPCKQCSVQRIDTLVLCRPATELDLACGNGNCRCRFLVVAGHGLGGCATELHLDLVNADISPWSRYQGVGAMSCLLSTTSRCYCVIAGDLSCGWPGPWRASWCDANEPGWAPHATAHVDRTRDQYVAIVTNQPHRAATATPLRRVQELPHRSGRYESHHYMNRKQKQISTSWRENFLRFSKESCGR